MASNTAAGLFPALLKHWRGSRGMSQLDLALAANVSSRHVSFIETGRAQPSREMVLRLAAALSVPLRDQNALLLAAGQPEVFPTPSADDVLAGPIGRVVAQMLEHHEPFPMLVMTRSYDVLRMNHGASMLLAALVADPSALAGTRNAFHMLFDPRLLRNAVEDWPQLARAMVSRLSRESLERPGDEALSGLLAELFEYPDVPRDWRTPDLSQPSEPAMAVRLRQGDTQLAFLTTVTVFSAPQNVTVEELRIESYFPLDDATRQACAR